MAKGMIQVIAPKTESNKITLTVDYSKASGKAYKMAFRTGVHTDKKKQSKKRACRDFKKNRDFF